MKKTLSLPKDLLRGDSIFALLIFVVVGIFMVNLVVSVWHNVLYKKNVMEKAGIDNIKAVGTMLSRTSEALITANEMSMLRRTVVETGVENKLSTCRVILPDGQVIAASDPASITMIDVPKSWSGEVDEYSEELEANTAKIHFRLDVPGRGQATLEIEAEPRSQLAASIEPQAAQLAVACMALAVMLLVQRHARFRLKAIGAIQDALASVENGESDISTLELDPRLGQEAIVWNNLLGKQQSQKVRAAIDVVKESINVQSDVYNELIAAYDTLPLGLIIVGEQMQVHYANGAAAAFLQTNKQEINNKAITDFLKEQQVIERIRNAVSNIRAKRTVVELKQDNLDITGVLKYTIRPIHREELNCAVVVIEDITQQRVAEAARDSFIAKAAHELRAPLANIRLYAENALENCQQDPENTAKCLDVVNDEVRRLERVVAEILSVSEIEAGSFRPKRDDVHLDVLLDQLQRDYQVQAKEKQIKLEFQLPPKLPKLYSDRDKISLVLQNLLSNAIKYTPQGGEVRVHVTVENNVITIEITDTGIGISAEDKEKIFNKFYRANDKRISDISGSGLGLAIAKEIVKLHGGEISVESEIERGSTFTLTLPISQEVNRSEN
jgi:signal transduction histidine kinase